MELERRKMDAFLIAFVECAAWASIDENGEPFDRTGIGFAPEALDVMAADCDRFQELAGELIDAIDPTPSKCGGVYTAESRAGHDFFLTRNGHGAGFWDGDWPQFEGEELTKIAKRFGEMYLYRGDDDLIHVDREGAQP